MHPIEVADTHDTDDWAAVAPIRTRRVKALVEEPLRANTVTEIDPVEAMFTAVTELTRLTMYDTLLPKVARERTLVTTVSRFTLAQVDMELTRHCTMDDDCQMVAAEAVACSLAWADELERLAQSLPNTVTSCEPVAARFTGSNDDTTIVSVEMVNVEAATAVPPTTLFTDTITLKLACTSLAAAPDLVVTADDDVHTLPSRAVLPILVRTVGAVRPFVPGLKIVTDTLPVVA